MRKDSIPPANMVEIKNRMDKLLDFLEDMKPRPKGFLKSITPEKISSIPVDDGTITRDSKKFLHEAERSVDPVRKRIREIEDDNLHLADLRDRLGQLTGLPIDLETLSSVKRTHVKLGLSRSYSELSGRIEELGGTIQGSLLDRKEGLHSVMILYTASNKKEIEDALRGRIFTEINLDILGIKDLLLAQGMKRSEFGKPIHAILPVIDVLIENNLTKLEKIERSSGELSEKYLRKARAYSEALEVKLEKEAFSSSLFRTSYTSRITGWVEADRIPELQKIISSITMGKHSLVTRDPTKEEIDNDDVPTKMNNGWLGSIFESLTLTFSPPRYNEIDPSVWISIPFVLFFGLMLGDAGYGILLLLGSLFLLRIAGDSKFLKQAGIMGIMMGTATIIAGIWMGAFFGDLVPRVFMGDPEQPLYSLNLLGYQLPYDTLRDPMQLFQISLYLGLVQLNLGFVLLGYDRFRKGKYFGVVKGALSWFILQAGAVIIVGGLIIGWWELTPTLTYLGLGLFLIGAVLIAFEGGFMFLFDIEGYMGDLISYTRILALGLSTFGLAMAFNIVGAMITDIHIVLIPITILLLIFLHIFNLALQALGSGVHSLRLQLVEFFGRFYEGGGRLFEPFGIERLYSHLADQEKTGGRSR
ncbi:MAG: V-type ATP synthase subunit I [Thermoplasmatota archaeon]